MSKILNVPSIFSKIDVQSNNNQRKIMILTIVYFLQRIQKTIPGSDTYRHNGMEALPSPRFVISPTKRCPL